MVGKEGSILLGIDRNDGSTRTRRDLEFTPVWDGMIATSRRLYMAALDGNVVCLASPD